MALRFPPHMLKSYQAHIDKLLIEGGITKSSIKQILKEDTFKRLVERRLKRNKKIKQIPELYQLGELEDFYYNLLNEKHFEINKLKKIGEFDKKKSSKSAKVLASSMANNLSSKIEDSIYTLNGLNYWVWAPSSSDNPNLQHQQYYGLVSKIGETPSPDGDVPQLLPYCQCDRRYIDYKQAVKLGYNKNDKRYEAKLR